jgi:hypothetical protein
MIPNSNSLMLPFIPSSRRSFGPARVVYAIKVDDTGLDQSAQLEQMMPVTPIACEPRGIETQHRTNLSGAQGGDQAIEAGPFDGAARSATKIVVNDVDVGEAASTCDFDQLVLPPLAFQVRLDLLWRRLANINDRLTLQNGYRNESVMRCHR